MKKEFLLNITLLLTINFIVKPLYLFGVDAHIQNIVGTEEYGVYFSLFNLVFLLQFIIEPGIQSYNSRNIAIDPSRLHFHFPRILGLKTILFIPFFIGVLISFFCWDYTSERLHLVSIIALNLFLSTSYIYLRSNIAAIGKYRIDSLLSAFDKVLMLIILGILSWIEPFQSQFNLMWLVYGQFTAFFIACLVALLILRKHLKSLNIIFSLLYFKDLIRWSYPYIFILLSMSIYTKIDGVMLERFLDDNGNEAGIYAAGYRFVDALNMVGYLFASLLLPMYSSNLNSTEIIKDLLHTSLKILSVGVTIIALLFVCYGEHILPYIYTEANEYYAKVLSMLMLNFVGVSIAYLFGTLLVATERLRAFNILLLIGVLGNVILNLLFIPQMGAYGAAIATAFTQLFVLFGQIFLVYTQTHVKFNGKIYLQVISFGLLCTILFMSIEQYLEFSWMIKATVSIALSALFAFILRLIDVSALLSMLKKRTQKHE